MKNLMLTRLKNVWDKENECPESCACEKCRRDDEFVVRENLTDEEIKEIINSEYSDKKDDRLERIYLRRALKKFGDRYSYHSTKFDTEDREGTRSTKEIIITCKVHGDVTVKKSTFFDIGCPKCNKKAIISEEGGPKRIRNIEMFEEKLKEVHSQYSIIPEVSKYVNDRTPIELHCNKHNIDFFSKPCNIYKCEGCSECAKDRKLEIANELHKDAEQSLIRRIEEKYPRGFDFSEVDYKNHMCKLRIKCNTCGNIIERSVLIWNRRLKNKEYLCPECNKEPMRLKRMEKFKSKVEEAFPGHFDLSNVNFITYHVPATGFKCLKCGKEFDVPYPDNFLVGAGCPHCDFSIGESLVRNWIENNKQSITEYKEQLNINSSIISGRKDDWGVVIDFYIKVNNVTYWIEYNGEQHYTWCKHFHHTLDVFENQLKRDQNVRNYCKNNSITLIEIPYTYDKQKEVDLILNDVILNNRSSEEVITSPPIKYYRTKKEREEAEKDGKL